MSRLRPECGKGAPGSAPPDRQVLWGIYRAVSKRRSLAHGQLYDEETGKHCAMGCYWEDNNGSVNTPLIDEVAAVNDSVPPTATPKERWTHVMRWLRSKLGIA